MLLYKIMTFCGSLMILCVSESVALLLRLVFLHGTMLAQGDVAIIYLGVITRFIMRNVSSNSWQLNCCL